MTSLQEKLKQLERQFEELPEPVKKYFVDEGFKPEKRNIASRNKTVTSPDTLYGLHVRGLQECLKKENQYNKDDYEKGQNYLFNFLNFY